MPLIAANMSTALKSATLNQTDATAALTALGNALTTYILTNSTANLGVLITLTPSLADNQTDALSHLASEITTGTRLGTFVNPSPPPARLPLLPIPPLTLSITPTTNRDTAFLELCTQICNWLIAFGVV